MQNAPLNDYVIVRRAPDTRLVVVARTPRPFETVDVMERVFSEVNAWLDTLERGSLCLLVDIRRAPGRNDEGFEAAFTPLRTKMESGFLRVAVLVRSAVGNMQVQRHADQDQLQVQVFMDEGKALRWLNEA